MPFDCWNFERRVCAASRVSPGSNIAAGADSVAESDSGDEVLVPTPGWTSYHKRLQYQTYDITNLLAAFNGGADPDFGIEDLASGAVQQRDLAGAVDRGIHPAGPRAGRSRPPPRRRGARPVR